MISPSIGHRLCVCKGLGYSKPTKTVRHIAREGCREGGLGPALVEPCTRRTLTLMPG